MSTASPLVPVGSSNDQLIARLRQALTLATDENASLRSLLRTHESKIQELQAERQRLTHEVGELRRSIGAAEDEVARLRSLTQAQTDAIGRMATEHTNELSEANAARQSECSRLRSIAERLNATILSYAPAAQAMVDGASGVPKPLEWERIQKLPLHPLHTLRKVILADHRREELLRQGVALGGDNPVNDAGSSDLDPLLEDHDPDHHVQSEDATVWLHVCRRMHQVLVDRRRLLHLEEDDKDTSPTVFLLRSRHQLVGAWFSLHEDVLRLQNHLLALCKFIRVDVLEVELPWFADQQATPLQGNGPAQVIPHTLIQFKKRIRKLQSELRKHVEVVESMMADIMGRLHDTDARCVTEADRRLHGVETSPSAPPTA